MANAITRVIQEQEVSPTLGRLRKRELRVEERKVGVKEKALVSEQTEQAVSILKILFGGTALLWLFLGPGILLAILELLTTVPLPLIIVMIFIALLLFKK